MVRSLKAAFRVDASTSIGTGHVMRCLTLADALMAAGASCHFVMRRFSGGMEAIVRKRGHAVTLLPEIPKGERKEEVDEAPHASWLGTDWRTDATETIALLNELNPDWLVVDHYALDSKWESLARTAVDRIMVLDDLADRPHECDVLLDQNLGRIPGDYDDLLPAYAKRLIGPEFALLRREFQMERDNSLQRRRSGKIDSILVSMGGVDQQDLTSKVLRTLDSIDDLQFSRVVVVLGSACPNISEVSRQAERMTVPTRIYVNADNMAALMGEADLAIGAAGGTAWERCCLGLPALLVILAENQRSGAAALESAGAAVCLGEGIKALEALAPAVRKMAKPEELDRLSDTASRICDGLGTNRVIEQLIGGR